MKFNKIFLLAFLASAAAVFTFQRCQVLWTPEYSPCPEIDSFSPSGAAYDSVVTVKGRNFNPEATEKYRVRIGATEVDAANISVPDGETLLITVPKGIGGGKVSVEVKTADGCVAESEETFVYYYTATLVKKLAPTFTWPVGLSVDTLGNILVADHGSNQIKQVNSSGTLITTTYGNGSNACNADPTNIGSASFFRPSDVFVGSDGIAFVADRDNNVIRKFSSTDQNTSISVYAGKCKTPAFTNGSCTNSSGPARLSSPLSLDIGENVMYVADNGRIRKIDSPCDVDDLLFNVDGQTYFNAVAFRRLPDGRGPLFVSDGLSNTILRVKLNGDSEDVSMNQALLSHPADLVVNTEGTIFVVDDIKHQVFAIYPNGTIQALAGTGDPGSTDMVVGKEAQFKKPAGIALVPGNGQLLYVSDSGNGWIRQIRIE